MRICRLYFCLALCLFLSLPLMGCGRTAPSAETALPTETEETLPAAERHLQAARELLSDGDPAAAIALLEQALAETEEPRLRAILEELTAPMPLDLDYRWLSGDDVQVHSFTAEETYLQTVRYTLDYTAPEGMALQILGKDFSLVQDGFTTTGHQGCFEFEIDSEAVRASLGCFQLRFLPAEGDARKLSVQTLWPEDGTGEPQPYLEIGYLLADLNNTGNVQVHSFAVQEIEDAYRFRTEYTAVPGLIVDVLLETAEEDLHLWEESLHTAGQRETLEFEISKETFALGEYMEVCFTEEGGQWVAANFTFPMKIRLTDGAPMEEPWCPGYSLPAAWLSGGFTVHDCLVQRLDNDHVRYALELSVPLGSFVSILAVKADGSSEMLDMFRSTEPRGQYCTDIPGSILRESPCLSVLIGPPSGRSQYFEIPNGYFSACTDGSPVSEPEQLAFSLHQSAPNCTILGCAVQPLDNGFFRYTVIIDAAQTMRCTAFDPPEGESFFLSFATGLQAGIYSFCFDLDAETAARLAEITFCGILPGGRNTVAVLQNAVGTHSWPPAAASVISCS